MLYVEPRRPCDGSDRLVPNEVEAKSFKQRECRVECDNCGDIGWWRLADPFLGSGWGR
jgi:hypothetical protein